MNFKDKIIQAKQYIKANARILDRALFEFEFNNGSPQKVLDTELPEVYSVYKE